MKIDYLPGAIEALEDAPAAVQKAFFKQIKFLEQDLRHPSLKAKKYNEAQDVWQARSPAVGVFTSTSSGTHT